MTEITSCHHTSLIKLVLIGYIVIYFVDFLLVNLTMQNEAVSGIRYKLACVYQSAHQHSLSFPHEETLDPWLPIECPSD